MPRPRALVALVLLASQVDLSGAEQAPPAPTPAPSAQASPAPPTFAAEVEQVLVDVVVTDKKGTPITDLRQGEFTLSEDGAPQAIASFDAIKLADAPASTAPSRPAVSTNLEPMLPAQAGRSFVVVFDDVHLTPFQARQAKQAMAEFLKSGVREGDRVTIVATGGAAWWSARIDPAGRAELLAILKRLDGRLIVNNSPDRMSDYEAMRVHTFNDPEVEARVKRRFESRGAVPASSRDQDNFGAGGDPYVRGRASETYFQALARNRLTLEMVERLLLSMENVRGRKSMLLLSQGFIYDPNIDEFKRVVQASRRANVAIYFVNARGLDGMPSDFSAEFGPALDNRDVGAAFSETYEAVAGSESLASDSGGFTVRNTNDLAKGLQRIADETRAYYLLGYNSTNTKRDGRFRKIQVKVSRKGVELRARKGYYAPLEGGKSLEAKKQPGGPDPVLQAALDSPFESQDVPLRMTALVGDETLLGKAQTMIVADVDIERFNLEQKEGRTLGTLQFLMVVAHRETGEYFRYDQSIEMKLLPETRERLRTQWFSLARDFELAPGGYQAKLVVRDKRSGKVGTLVHDFDVPVLGQWRVSSPILTDVRLPDPPGSTPSKIPHLQAVARRSFASGGMLWCSYEVYGAAKEKANGMPRVAADYVVRKVGGAELARVPMTPITPTSLGRLSRMTGTPLDGAEPGDYELVITLKDEIGGQTREIKEPFTVVAAAKP